MAAKRSRKATPAKRARARTDVHRALPDHVVALLRTGHAHLAFEDVLAESPAALRGPKPPGQPFTPWRILDHIRSSQWAMADFTKSATHVPPAGPSGLWPN